MKYITKFTLVFLLVLLSCSIINAQVGINTDNSSPNSSAMLDIKSNDKGILIPRLTTNERATIVEPATGLLVFDTDTESFWFNKATGWTELITTDKDEQQLSFDGSTLSIDNGNFVDLSAIDTDTQLSESEVDAFVSNNGYITSPDDADADPTNEIELPANNGTDGQFLQTDGTGNVTWATHTDNVNDNDANASNELQTLSFSDMNLSISDGNTVNLSALVDDEDWGITSGTNITNLNEGNVGIGNIASSQNRWQLTVKDTVDCMLGSDTIDASELFAVFTRNINENNTGIGIGFQSTTTVTGIGAAIVHERTNSNSRGKLHFATKSSGDAADEDIPIRMTLDESGRLGIGTTSPSDKLHVSGGDIQADRGTSTGSLSRTISLGGARNGDSSFGIIDFENYDSDGPTEYVGASIRANNGGDATNNGNLRFFTYDGSLTEQMRISESGQVGIGETSPQASLDVVDVAVIGNLSVSSESTDQGTSNAAGDGFTATPWLYTNAVEAQGERGSASTLITIGADGTHGAADQINFVTSGNAQMTVASDGKIGIDEKAPEADLHIRQSGQSLSNGTGGIRFENSGDDTDWWRVYHSGIYCSFNLQGSRVAYVNTNGAWTVDSDRRLKKNISTMRPTLDKLMQMRPVKYHYREQNNQAGKTLGFIAQEVQPLFPEMVVTGEDGHLGMTYSTTGVIAVKAIQEQQAIIDDQQAQLDAQHQEIQNLKAMMLKLQAMLKE